MTLFECLSNDILLEIFEYLDGCHIFHSFGNLNRRFEHLIGDLPSGLHFDLRSEREWDLLEYCRNTLAPCRNSIVSLRLPTLPGYNRFFSCDDMGASFFPRLESIVLVGVPWFTWRVLGRELVLLPRMHSFSVHFIGLYDEILPHEMYEPIRRCSALKYCHVSSEAHIRFFVTPTDPNHSQSPIEQLKIDHCCTKDFLFDTIRHLPQLSAVICRRLEVQPLSQSWKQLRGVVPNLRSFILQQCDDLPFDVLEPLLQQISHRLQVLKVNAFKNHSHFSAYRWERLISHHMPELKKFTLIGSLFDRNRGSFYQSVNVIRR